MSSRKGCHFWLDPSLLGVTLAPGTKVDGCVVFPSIPFSTDPSADRKAFGIFPTLLSVSELERALAKR